MLTRDQETYSLRPLIAPYDFIIVSFELADLSMARLRGFSSNGSYDKHSVGDSAVPTLLPFVLYLVRLI